MALIPAAITSTHFLLSNIHAPSQFFRAYLFLDILALICAWLVVRSWHSDIKSCNTYQCFFGLLNNNCNLEWYFFCLPTNLRESFFCCCYPWISILSSSVYIINYLKFPSFICIIFLAVCFMCLFKRTWKCSIDAGYSIMSRTKEMSQPNFHCGVGRELGPSIIFYLFKYSCVS